MKKLILLAFVLLPVLLSGQVLKGTGISYFDSIPNVAPSLPKGTEIALGIKTKKLYRWDRTCSCWIELETSTDSLARTVLASGLFNEYAVPFGGSTGKLDQSAAFKFILGQLQANSFATLGSAGAGYVGLSPQSSVPATPASGIRVYADASGRFGWIGTNGYTRVFDASGITANRIFKLQNKTYTLADSADVASLSASLPGAYFPLPGGTLTGTGGAGFVGFPSQSSAPSAPGAGFRVFANGAGNMGVIRSDGYVTTFDFSTATGNRFFTYPANAGTFGILENTQTWTGVNTFAPTGTGGAGFVISTTSRSATIAPVMTDAQVGALTGQTAGGWVYSSTQQRPYVHNGSGFQGVVLGPQSGFTVDRIPYATTGGNLTMDADFYKAAATGDAIYNLQGSAAANASTIRGGISGYAGYSHIMERATTNGSRGYRLVVGTYNAMQVSIDNGNVLFPFNIVVGNTAMPNFGVTEGVKLYVSNGAMNNGFSGAGATINNTGVVTIEPSQYTSSAAGITYTNASSLRVKGAPTAGTNTTITNSYSIFAAGQSFLERVVTEYGSAIFNSSPIAGITSKPAIAHYVISRPGTSNPMAIFAQTTATTNTSVYGVVGEATGNSGASGGSFYGLYASVNGNTYSSTSNYFGTYSFVRLNSGATGSHNMHGVYSQLDLYSTNVGGGTAANFAANYYAYATRNNTGASTLAFYYSLGVQNPSGSNTTITNLNPLALNSGSSTNVTNVWSYLDHRLHVGSTANVASSAILELTSTDKGLLIPRATDAQISAISSPALGLQAFSTTTERLNVKRTSGFFQIAYTQDIKRDTSYQITNTNLDISGQTANFKNRYHTVRIATAVTAAATANNVITMPVPHADLLGINFKVSVVDVSGDGDISQLSFGTDGVDGYLSNGDGTYALTQNLYPGLGVYVSVAWDQNKSAYRWFLQ